MADSINWAVHFVCHQCQEDTSSQGATTPWIRCSGCNTLVGFSWCALKNLQGFQYGDFGGAAKGGVTEEDRQRYAELLEAADQAAAQGDEETCGIALRNACKLATTAFAYFFPERVHEDAAYRAQHLDYTSWTLLQQKMNAKIHGISKALFDAASEVDVDKLDSLLKIATLCEAQVVALAEAGGPPDPDLLPIQARARIAMTFALSAYLDLVSPEMQRRLLERIHGAGNVELV